MYFHPWGACPNNPSARAVAARHTPIVAATKAVVSACGRALVAVVDSRTSESPLWADEGPR